jgi:tetratricopeptide (TPR) repeat protein
MSADFLAVSGAAGFSRQLRDVPFKCLNLHNNIENTQSGPEDKTMSSPAEILNLAVQYHAAGNLPLAEQFAASIVAEDPNHAGALHLLGLIAQQKGMLREAMDYLNRSLTADGANSLVWQHAGDLHLIKGDVGGGITCYEQVLRLQPDFAEGHNALGLALMRAGKLERAVECFQLARRLAPSFAPALNNLGMVLNQQGKWAEAAEVLEEALRVRPDVAEVASNLGNARFYQGNWPEAIRWYRRALELRPGKPAEVCISLAAALRRQGQWQEAVAQYQEALRLRPGHGMAIYQLSELAAQGPYAFPPEELSALREALVSGRLGEENRRLYAFALGNVLDRQGAFDEAFSYYRQGNELLLGLFKKRDAAFNRRAHQARVEALLAEQGEAYFDKVKDWRTAAEVPVFIVGLPCSGTTLVVEMLTAHPRISRVGEAGSVLRFLAPASVSSPTTPTAAALLPDRQAAQDKAATYLQLLAQLGPGATRVLVNSFDNSVGLGLIATLFCEARVIHCRRESLDVAVACYFQNRRDLPFACTLEDLGAYCRAYEKLMAHWAKVLPLTIHEVRFEDLIQEREKTARHLITYCGLDWDERCGAAARTDSTDLSGAEPVGRGQHYRQHLGPLLKALETLT